jgi:hypothetical protein
MKDVAHKLQCECYKYADGGGSDANTETQGHTQQTLEQLHQYTLSYNWYFSRKTSMAIISEPNRPCPHMYVRTSFFKLYRMIPILTLIPSCEYVDTSNTKHRTHIKCAWINNKAFITRPCLAAPDPFHISTYTLTTEHTTTTKGSPVYSDPRGLVPGYPNDISTLLHKDNLSTNAINTWSFERSISKDFTGHTHVCTYYCNTCTPPQG